MGMIILDKLEAKPRKVLRDGCYVETKSSAFVGATDDEMCQFGIGLIDEQQRCMFWALVHPHLLITAWKGMHVLDRVTNVLHGTICYAYYAGSSDYDDSDVKRALVELAAQIPDLDELRKQVLAMPIDDATLDTMLKICNSSENHIAVSEYELQEAVQAGIIHQTDEVSRVYQIALDQRLERERDEQISKQPLPESKSFRVFCERYDIKYLFDSPYYDWPGYWEIDRVDEAIVYDGLRFEGVQEVWCAEHSPQSLGGVGHVGQPILQLSDERTVVLVSVRFKDDDMWVMIRPANEKDGEWLTLSALSALKPKFIGLTIINNSHSAPEDVERGYFAVRTTVKSLVQKVISSVKTSRG